MDQFRRRASETELHSCTCGRAGHLPEISNGSTRKLANCRSVLRDSESRDDDRGQCFARTFSRGTSHASGNLGGGDSRNVSTGDSSGGCQFRQGSHRPGVAPIGADVGLAERYSQQTRAQEQEAGRRQGKKSVGDNVVVAHDTPTTPDSLPNSLKLSESLTEPSVGSQRSPEPPSVQTSSPITIAFKCMSQENACAHQAHHRCNRLNHRTNPYAPLHAQNDSTVAQSKRFTGLNRRSVVSDDLLQQIV